MVKLGNQPDYKKYGVLGISGIYHIYLFERCFNHFCSNKTPKQWKVLSVGLVLNTRRSGWSFQIEMWPQIVQIINGQRDETLGWVFFGEHTEQSGWKYSHFTAI